MTPSLWTTHQTSRHRETVLWQEGTEMGTLLDPWFWHDSLLQDYSSKFPVDASSTSVQCRTSASKFLIFVSTQTRLVVGTGGSCSRKPVSHKYLNSPRPLKTDNSLLNAAVKSTSTRYLNTQTHINSVGYQYGVELRDPSTPHFTLPTKYSEDCARLKCTLVSIAYLNKHPSASSARVWQSKLEYKHI